MKPKHILILSIVVLSFSSCDFGCDDDPSGPEIDIYPVLHRYPPRGYENMSRSPIFIWDGNLQEDFDDSYRFTFEIHETGETERESFYVGRDTIFHFPDTLESGTEYGWRVLTEASGDRRAYSVPSTFWTGTGFNSPPALPVPLYPVKLSDVPLDIALRWRGYDPDGDEMIYDLWYKKDGDIDSIYISGIADSEYNLPLLDADTRYYWRVYVEVEPGVMRGTNTLASFSTIVTQPPHDPFPPDGAVDQPVDIILSWSCIDPDGDDLTYDVDIGRAGGSMSRIATGIAQNELPVVGLIEGVTYEWKVTAEDDDGHRTAGPLWSFTTIGGSDVVFADLSLTRQITKSGAEILVIDNIWARFDDRYAPDYALSPLRPDTVICEDIGLEWQESRNRFYYENAHTLSFLVPGTAYEFSVAQGGGVPALTRSILFPRCAPQITSPAAFDPISLDGFTVTWTGYDEFPDCDRQVSIAIEEMGGIPTGVYITTENDGSYSFTAGELSAIDPSLIDLQIVLTVENIENIDSPGYDPRSWIRARTRTVQMVYVQ